MRRRSRRLLALPSLATALLGGLAGGCRPASDAPAQGAPAASDVVARYRGGEIRRSELDAWHAERPFLQGEVSEEKWGLDSLEALVVVHHLAGEAAARGRDREPLVAFELESREEQVLVGALRSDLREAVPIAEAEVAALLAEHDADRQKPERRQLRYLLKEVPEGAGAAERDALRREMEALRERVLAGEDFAAVAREASDSATRFRGGLLGTVDRGQLPPVLDEAAFALPEGGVSAVLEAERSLVILQCGTITPARRMPEAEARQRIEGFLRDQRGAEAWASLQADVTSGQIEHDATLLATEGAPADTVVGRIGGEPLTRARLDLVLAEALPRAEPGTVPVAQAIDAIEGYATRRLLAAEARRRGVAERPETQARIALERQFLLARLELRRRLDAATPAPSEDAVRGYVAEHGSELRSEARFRVAVLWRPRRAGSEQQDAARLAAARARLAAGAETFAEAAARDSEHASARTGGDLGWRSQRELAAWGPLVMKTVLALEPGELSGVVETERGFLVVRLVEREAPRPLAPEEAAAEARRILDQQGREAARRRLFRALLADLAVERTEALDAATPAAEPRQNEGSAEALPSFRFEN